MVTSSRIILIATDNDHLRQAAADALAPLGHEVRPASPSPEGRAALLVLDANLGSPRVAAMLHEVTGRQPGLPVVLVQSDADMRGWGADPEGGFRGYLPAPFSARGLVGVVERALRNAPPAAVLTHAPESLLPSPSQAATALETLVQAIETRDSYLPGHSLRVAELAAALAARLGRADWEVDEVRLAGRLHDLGMIAIPDAQLGRAGPLTREEYAEVRRHPELGHDILRGYPYMERVARYVRGHHERWDGTGYPDGLAGAAIPWGAQVLAAAETFDALTSPRAYRPAHSLTQALERMYAQAAAFINPEVMREMGRVVSQLDVAGAK